MLEPQIYFPKTLRVYLSKGVKNGIVKEMQVQF
jgi:hypothetical protein